MAIRQHDAVSCYASLVESMYEPLRRLLPTVIGLGVEGYGDGPGTGTQLLKLAPVEMVSQRACDVANAGLPKHGVVKQTFHKNHVWVLPDGFPQVQTAFRFRQKPVRWRRTSNAAAIEITFEGKGDAPGVLS
ncbi:MAG TPA: hypothetical protein VK638_46790 [Edaphobacter sp.]|nr:hypothetical protein [Edaphobacter sp.]